MLTYTYVHASGIGLATEKRIWEAGVGDWNSFLETHGELGLSDRHRSLLVPVVEESLQRFADGDYLYFAQRLASREHWRAFGELGDRAAFLDIETTGMYSHDGVTVIGLYDGKESKTFVKGFNMDEFPREIEKYPLLVTYAGASFDLPFLRRAFPGTHLRQLHIDLCPTLRRLGLKGGLKHIEQEMGISRDSDILGLDGWDAVRLWNEWEHGNRASLDTLIDYNTADTVNLKSLAEHAYRQLRELLIVDL